MTAEEIAAVTDYTNLKADATPDDITKLCGEAKKYKFAAVCVNSSNVKQAAGELRGSGVRVCSVVGFPLGAASSEAKACEAETAAKDGAEEIDMVMNIGRLKAGLYGDVKADIEAVVRAAPSCAVKVIIEACLLDDGEKVKACLLAKEAGAGFVKTSTGFLEGAKPEDVRLMRETVGDAMGVKAAGGIRSLDAAERMISAGADRLGTSRILTGQGR